MHIKENKEEKVKKMQKTTEHKLKNIHKKRNMRKEHKKCLPSQKKKKLGKEKDQFAECKRKCTWQMSCLPSVRRNAFDKQPKFHYNIDSTLNLPFHDNEMHERVNKTGYNLLGHLQR